MNLNPEYLLNSYGESLKKHNCLKCIFEEVLGVSERDKGIRYFPKCFRKINIEQFYFKENFKVIILT